MTEYYSQFFKLQHCGGANWPHSLFPLRNSRAKGTHSKRENRLRVENVTPVYSESERACSTCASRFHAAGDSCAGARVSCFCSTIPQQKERLLVVYDELVPRHFEAGCEKHHFQIFWHLSSRIFSTHLTNYLADKHCFKSPVWKNSFFLSYPYMVHHNCVHQQSFILKRYREIR